jgi:hypothetical protein
MTSPRYTRYGTHPDVPDHRDHVYHPPRSVAGALPRRVRVLPRPWTVFDQGRTLNSCSANAIGAAIWFLERRRRPLAPPPSRLFLYYNERAREDLTGSNAPVSLRSGYKSVAAQGLCAETMWPYRDDRFAVRPPADCYHAALAHRAIHYFRLRRELLTLHRCLAEGFPFTVGLSVYVAFESAAAARTGVVPLPKRRERHLGGHAVLIVGYDQGQKTFTFQNSAGRRWGRRGFGTLPDAYLLDEQLAWDFWTVRHEGSGPRRQSRALS